MPPSAISSLPREPAGAGVPVVCTGQGGAGSAGELPVVLPGVPPFAGGLWGNGRIPGMVVPSLAGQVAGAGVARHVNNSALEAPRSMRETRSTGGGLHHFH